MKINIYKITQKYLCMAILLLSTAVGFAQNVSLKEKDALLAFYNATGGPNWTSTKQGRGVWDLNKPVTSWYGVTVENGKVVGLDLNRNNLVGVFPELIKNLTELKLLILDVNEITGSMNYLCELKKLQVLGLYRNNLTGGIPSDIGNLINLSILYLHYNNNLGGIIPTTIGNLKELIDLKLLYCKLSGNIPASIGQLTKLIYLHLGSNELYGDLPITMNNMNSLRGLDIGFNYFRFINLKNTFTKLSEIDNLPPTSAGYDSNTVDNFYYSYQNYTDTPYPKTLLEEQTVTFTMCEDNRFLKEDTFQWYKNGQIIPGATSRIYTIPSLTVNDAGVYTCKSQNPSMQKLILERNPITLNVKVPCYDCTSFEPIPTKKYLISGWVKEELSETPEVQLAYYTQSYLGVSFTGVSGTLQGATQKFAPTGDIVDGWQRIVGEFTVPEVTAVDDINIELINEGTSNRISYFDDIRVLPTDGSMKSFVYDQQTQRLMAELDENNYSTFYEYDLEGGLIRIKKETEKGVFTIQETRSGNPKVE